MDKNKIEHFEKKLEAEKAVLESDLKSVGRINPEIPGEWEATPAEKDVSHSDENERSNAFDEYEENEAILQPLEVRYNNVKKALEKIKIGKGFGICEVCGKPIETDRLEANPAAATCKEHMSVH